MRRKLDVLMVFDCQVSKKRGYDYKEEFEQEDCRVYRDIHRALKNNGHEVRLLGIKDDIRPLLDEVEEKKPDLVFNVADVFRSKANFDKNIAWLLEMLGVTYTGGSPANLALCNNKALSKKILSFHRIKVPNFHSFYREQPVQRPKKRMGLPIIVKPLCEEASRGISLASVIDTDPALKERVEFIHEHMQMDAIGEEYIEGREFYVSILGNKRMKALPIREMKFGLISDEESRIATYKAKWDNDYRSKWGIKNVFAGRLPEGWEEKIVTICKRAYRALHLDGYARFDVRVTPEGQVYVIEVNLNPSLERDDEFERSANKAGISFDELIQKIVFLAFNRIGK
ncbi:MAG: ATP-grasp domain-containing protein [Candidatus Omnitrophota bacterium]